MIKHLFIYFIFMCFIFSCIRKMIFLPQFFKNLLLSEFFIKHWPMGQLIWSEKIVTRIN